MYFKNTDTDNGNSVVNVNYLNSNYIRIGLLNTSISYTSGGYKDVNVSQLTGKNILGILSVGAYGTRDNVNFGVVSANTGSYTISISVYSVPNGGGVPASTSAHSVQIWYYY